MKTRVNLNFFLRKRGTSLEKICLQNKIHSKEGLLEYLGSLDVERPDDAVMDGLFSVKKKHARKKASPRVQKQEVIGETRDTLQTPEEVTTHEKSKVQQSTRSQNSSRRKRRNRRSED